jgi:hypothetical protein
MTTTNPLLALFYPSKIDALNTPKIKRDEAANLPSPCILPECEALALPFDSAECEALAARAALVRRIGARALSLALNADLPGTIPIQSKCRMRTGPTNNSLPNHVRRGFYRSMCYNTRGDHSWARMVPVSQHRTRRK